MKAQLETSSILLQAFSGTNTRVPVWFMRQAGRYLPEYQVIRAKHSLDEMFQEPDIVTEVTCLPIDILGVDAAILFADILTLPSQMGFEITFDKNRGPVIKNPIHSVKDIRAIHDFEDLSHIAQSIKMIVSNLDANVPLIGFAGAPFTVLTYLIEGGSSKDFERTMDLARREEGMFDKMMRLLTENTINYLKLQKENGVKVFQLFDTWAGILDEEAYMQYVLPYTVEIFNRVELPSIYYMKKAKHLLPLMQYVDCDFLSVSSDIDIGADQTLLALNKGVQGNLNADLLYKPEREIGGSVDEILKKAINHNKYIFNLGHGVKPDIDPQKLKYVVKQVHAFDWEKDK